MLRTKIGDRPVVVWPIQTGVGPSRWAATFGAQIWTAPYDGHGLGYLLTQMAGRP